MSNDFLSSNKSFKGILKNPDPKSSLAATSSILRKDPTKVHTEGIGLNPNFNIEDEYIQNLQKQIHFMDLEIKLLKEKQEQDEALGGNYNFQKIGLRDGKAISDHIITATTKYKDMKRNLKNQELIIDEQLTKAKEETTTNRSKVDYVKKNLTEQEERIHQSNLEMAKDLNDAKTRLLQERKQREDLEHELERIKKQLENFKALNANLKKDRKVMDVDDHLAKVKFDADEAVDRAEEKDKDETLAHLKEDKEKYLGTIQKDAKLQALTEDNAELRKRALINEKELNQATYKVQEYETLQELSIRKKDEEIEKRKKLQVELEKWQDQLQETIKNNELKVEKKLRESESQELKRRQGELLKEERELADLKTKLAALEVEERKHTIEREFRIEYLTSIQEKNKKKEEQAELYAKEIELLDPKMNELLGHVELLELKLHEKREDRERIVEKLRHVEEENIALLTSYNYLASTIHIDDDMKNINLEELRSLIQNNEMVNDSINEFIQKWGFLRQFAKRG